MCCIRGIITPVSRRDTNHVAQLTLLVRGSQALSSSDGMDIAFITKHERSKEDKKHMFTSRYPLEVDVRGACSSGEMLPTYFEVLYTQTLSELFLLGFFVFVG